MRAASCAACRAWGLYMAAVCEGIPSASPLSKRDPGGDCDALSELDTPPCWLSELGAEEPAARTRGSSSI